MIVVDPSLSVSVQVPRQFPFDNLYLERGGDPTVPPSQRNTTGKVKATYGETF